MTLTVEQLEDRICLSTLLVTSSDDNGLGTLRQAILDSQSGDSIHFAIPAPITLETDLPAITQSVEIDGFSQLGSHENTSATTDNAIRSVEIDGSLLAKGSVGFRINADNVTVNGIAFTHFNGQINGSTGAGANIIVAGMNDSITGCLFDGSGSGVVVSGSFITFGGSSLADRNSVIHASAFGIFIVGENNTIEGNFIGNDGIQSQANGADGIHVEGNSNHILNNVLSGNDGAGIAISGGTQNLVELNMIGVGMTMNAIANSSGVHLAGTEDNNSIMDNVIALNGGDGVLISSFASRLNIIQGNAIGTDDSGLMDLGNKGYGVEINAGGAGFSLNNIIGGPAANEGNMIAFNDQGGVLIVDAQSSGNTIDPNSIYSNSSLGIDLQNGSNGGIAAPDLQAVIPRDGHLMLAGNVHGNPLSTYILEFFANETATNDGKVFVGRLSLTTDSTGFAHFCFDTVAKMGNFFTATMTDAQGNTSEFSAPVALRSLVEAANVVSVPSLPAFNQAFFATLAEKPQEKIVSSYSPSFAPAVNDEEESVSESVPIISESECCLHSGSSCEEKQDVFDERRDNEVEEQE